MWELQHRSKHFTALIFIFEVQFVSVQYKNKLIH